MPTESNENGNPEYFALEINQSIKESENQNLIENLITHNMMAQSSSSGQRIEIVENVIRNVFSPSDQNQLQRSLSKKSEEQEIETEANLKKSYE